MLIDNQKTRETLSDVKTAGDKYNQEEQRIVQLQEELRVMGNQSNAVQRTGNIIKINKFNKLITSKTAELSRLRQTRGTIQRRDVEQVIQNEDSNISLTQARR